MLLAYRTPAPLSAWTDGAVLVRMGAGQRVSRFPAMPRAMLVMHLAHLSGGAFAVSQPPTFHTLTTGPTEHTHAEGIVAIGLIVLPAAAACLLASTCGAVTNQVLPWHAVAGTAEAASLQRELEAIDAEEGFLNALMASFARAMHTVPLAQWQYNQRLCEAVGLHGARAADLMAIGRRQLERRCKATLGVSPKQFERLDRFHRALTATMLRDASSLAQDSLDAGYCDQSHLGLEARQLGGASVLKMKSQAAPGSPWWALSTPRALRGATE